MHTYILFSKSSIIEPLDTPMLILWFIISLFSLVLSNTYCIPLYMLYILSSARGLYKELRSSTGLIMGGVPLLKPTGIRTPDKTVENN